MDTSPPSPPRVSPPLISHPRYLLSLYPTQQQLPPQWEGPLWDQSLGSHYNLFVASDIKQSGDSRLLKLQLRWQDTASSHLNTLTTLIVIARYQLLDSSGNVLERVSRTVYTSNSCIRVIMIVADRLIWPQQFIRMSLSHVSPAQLSSAPAHGPIMVSSVCQGYCPRGHQDKYPPFISNGSPRTIDFFIVCHQQHTKNGASSESKNTKSRVESPNSIFVWLQTRSLTNEVCNVPTVIVGNVNSFKFFVAFEIKQNKWDTWHQ